MIRKKSVHFLIFALMEFVTSQITQPTTSCEPFFSGAGPQEVLAATLNPFNPCPSNCSAEQAARFVRFYYYDRNTNTFPQLDVQNPSESQFYEYPKGVTFLIHGYANQALNGWMPPTAIQLAKTADRLIILVDYAKLANSNYLLSATKTAPGVGSYIYNKIMQFKFNLTQVGMIGHSLGAHVAGHVGKASKGLLNEIIGLDPAGPYFDTMGTGLYHTDAVHVLVLHTSRDFGTLLSRGDIDYYASKDRIVQPGCETAVYKPGCSHDKCLYIYNAALYPNNKIIAVKCSSQADTVQFGESSIKTGEYCFEAEACYKYNN